jgi:hypothetical protein
MIQPGESLGWEGWLAPAPLEHHSTSGGKPPFLTCEISKVEFFHLSSNNFAELLCPCGN